MSVPFVILSLLYPMSFAESPTVEQPQYSRVLTAEERNVNNNYMHFPNWQDLVIVYDGAVNDVYARQVDVSQWDKALSLESFKWLIIQNLDIQFTSIASVKTTTFVPFVVGIRYQAKGPFWSEMLFQGTINASGALELVMQDEQVVDVRIARYYDSQNIEQYERKLGLIDQYNGYFVAGVLSPLLKNYFVDSHNLQALVDLVANEGSIKL